jgi:hypothetical protein
MEFVQCFWGGGGKRLTQRHEGAKEDNKEEVTMKSLTQRRGGAKDAKVREESEEAYMGALGGRTVIYTMFYNLYKIWDSEITGKIFR